MDPKEAKNSAASTAGSGPRRSRADGDHAEVLNGGNVNTVVRVGATVHRSAGPWTSTIHAFLSHLYAHGVTCVPAPLGIDAEGREVLRWIDGEVAGWPPPAWVWSPETRTRAGRMLRAVHDASRDFRPAAPQWRMPAHEPQEVICLNDVAPYNMVHDGRDVVAFIDVDMASPGPRAWDLAYLAYRICGWCEDMPAPPQESNEERLNQLLDAYGREVAPSIADVMSTMRTRLVELAEWTERHSREAGASDLAAHAAMYRRDASRL